MAKKKPFQGIITTVNTPFNDDMSIAWEDLRRTAEYALDAGVSGFLAPCFASEIDCLSWEERFGIARELVEICRKRGQGIVVPNVTAQTLEDCVSQAKQYLEVGVDGINVYLPDMEYSLIRDVLREVDRLNPPFLSLQDTKHNEFPPAFIKELYDELPSLTSVKLETAYPGPEYTAVLKLTNGEMNVCGAWGSDQMIEAYDRGMDALMPSGLFDLFVNVYRLYHEKSRDAAMKLFFDILPIIVFTRQSDPVNYYLHKRYYQRLGLYRNVSFRVKEWTVDEVQKAYAEEMINRAFSISARMEEYWK